MTAARHCITWPPAARPDTRVLSSARQGAARRRDRAPDPRARARGRVIRPVPGTPTCESPCARARAPGAWRSHGSQSCRAALPIHPTSPMNGRLAAPDVRAISRLARPNQPRCPAAGAAVPRGRMRHPRAPARARAPCFPWAAPQARPAPRGQGAPRRVSGCTCEEAASRAPSARRERLMRMRPSKMRPARAPSGSAPLEAPEPTARSAPRG
jgi:hypothetical protein